jgi:hypothetical protein
LKHKSTQPLYIFNRENPQNSEPQNGPRSGLDYIALVIGLVLKCAKNKLPQFLLFSKWFQMIFNVQPLLKKYFIIIINRLALANCKKCTFGHP